MEQILSVAGWLLLVTVLGGGIGFWIAVRRSREEKKDRSAIFTLIKAHFHPTPVDNLTISERRFPFRVRADLQRAIDRLFGDKTTISHFCGVRKEYSHEGITLTDCLVPSDHNPAVSTPPQYEEIDIGDDHPIRCLKTGLWFLRKGNTGTPFYWPRPAIYGQVTGMQFQIADANTPDGERSPRVLQASGGFRPEGRTHTGESPFPGTIGVLLFRRSLRHHVHQLRKVERDQVILPPPTLDLLDATSSSSCGNGPTGRVRPADQEGDFSSTARPAPARRIRSTTWPEPCRRPHDAAGHGRAGGFAGRVHDAGPAAAAQHRGHRGCDLIARDRTELTPANEVLLNKLLNEMDGLREEADILFLLTTNRPEELEQALASRPGRIDQAIEFPLPDDEGRENWFGCTRQGVHMAEEVVQEIVQRTERVSAAFIKELMRRSVQFHLERKGSADLEGSDVERP